MNKNVHVRRKNGRILYKVYLYLSGRDLPYVKSVTYKLHSSFQNPEIKIRRTASNPECVLSIWTWGLFRVYAEVEDKFGNIHRLMRVLRYDEQLRKISKEKIEFE